MADTNYCALQDVTNKLSAYGVALGMDDDPGVYPEVVSEASSVIDEYLLRHYRPADLAASRWVRYRCAAIAAGLLMERRGNSMPRSLLRRLEKIEESLTAASQGVLQVPGLSRIRTSVPALSQPRTVLTPLGPVAVISRWRGSREQPRDYPQRRDITEPPLPYPN